MVINQIKCTELRFADFTEWLPSPETNSSPMKIDGWKMNFLLGAHFSEAMLVFVQGISLSPFFLGFLRGGCSRGGGVPGEP